jgi:hypothetical protein
MIPMKGLPLLMLVFLCFSVDAAAQNGKIPSLDKSALDVTYYPINYPVLKIQDKVNGSPYLRVIYSRPQKNGREVYGGLVEYGQIWRVGANESTEIEFFRDVNIGNTRVKKGRYSLYAIPRTESWTLIINRDTDSWGAFKYDQKKDVARFEAKPEKNVETAEAFSIYFEPISRGVNLYIHWDNTRTALPIIF